MVYILFVITYVNTIVDVVVAAAGLALLVDADVFYKKKGGSECGGTDYFFQ